MQRRHFKIIIFCNPLNVGPNGFAILGGDEIMTFRATVKVTKEWPNALLCLNSVSLVY